MTFSQDCVQKLVSRGFYHLGKFMYRNPTCFFLVPIFCTILGLIYADVAEDMSNPIDMIFITGGKVDQAGHRSNDFFGGGTIWESSAIEHHSVADAAEHDDLQERVKRHAVVDGKSGNGSSVMDHEGTANNIRRSDDHPPDHKPREYLLMAIILTKNESLNILTQHFLDQVVQVHKDLVNFIQAADGIECIDCVGSKLLNQLVDIVDDYEAKKFNFTWPAFVHPEKYDTVLLPGLIAKPELSDDGVLLSTPGLLLVYKYIETKPKTAVNFAFSFIRYPEQLEKNYTELTISTNNEFHGLLDRESKLVMVAGVLPNALAAILVISIISSWSWDPVKLKIIPLMLTAVYSIMAAITTVGFLRFLGVQWLALNYGIVFFVLGVGIDDAFVLLAAWRNTNPALSAEERMGQMFSEAAVAVTVTSLTDSLSFWIGTYTPLRFCRIFCIYSGTAMAMLYFFQISLFGATLAVFARFERQNRHAIGCCRLPQREDNNEVRVNSFWRICCTGDGKGKLYGSGMQEKSLSVKLFRDYWAPFIQMWPVKVIAFLVYAVYISGAIYCYQGIKTGRSVNFLLTRGTPWHKFGELLITHFGYMGPRFQVGIYGELDYSDAKVQSDMERLTQELESHPWIAGELYTDSWLRGFLGFIDTNSEYLPLNVSTEDEFVQTLQKFYSVNPQVSSNLKFSPDGKRIVASRFFFQAMAFNIPEEDFVHLPGIIRGILDKYPGYDLEAYDKGFFWYEKDLILPGYAYQAIGLAAVTMLVIAFLFIPNVTVALWIAFTMLSIIIGVAGYLVPFGATVDLVYVISLLMCIGFSVDFASHISYAFFTSQSEDPRDKITDALGRLGWPILQAAVTTFSGAMWLVVLPTYMYQILGLTTVFIMTFGLFHGLVLLPMLLETTSRMTQFCVKKCRKGDEEGVVQRSMVSHTLSSFITDGTGNGERMLLGEARRENYRMVEMGGNRGMVNPAYHNGAEMEHSGFEERRQQQQDSRSSGNGKHSAGLGHSQHVRKSAAERQQMPAGNDQRPPLPPKTRKQHTSGTGGSNKPPVVAPRQKETTAAGGRRRTAPQADHIGMNGIISKEAAAKGNRKRTTTR